MRFRSLVHYSRAGCRSSRSRCARLRRGQQLPRSGANWLRALAPVFPGVAFCPTGGIDETRAAEYLTLANVPMVGGSWMVPRDAVAAGDWRRIRRLAERAAAIGRREAA